MMFHHVLDMFRLLLHYEEDVENFKNGKGVDDKKSDKPPFFSTSCSKPQSVSFPRKDPKKKDYHEPCISVCKV
jgi:hypothetical protein